MFYKNSNNIYFEVFFKLYGIYSTPTDSPYSSAYIFFGGWYVSIRAGKLFHLTGPTG